ncbi:MAG TPA: hypothetical protein VEZ89_00265, partial [Rubrivivax sp.]|nr:hypothetical protein [Rubrivivax sp.]
AAIVGVRVHLDGGRLAVQAFMHAYCVGLLWRSALAAVFCWLVPSTGAGWAMLLACGAVAIGTWMSHLVVERTRSRFAPQPLDAALPPLPMTAAVLAPIRGEQP